VLRIQGLGFRYGVSVRLEFMVTTMSKVLGFGFGIYWVQCMSEKGFGYTDAKLNTSSSFWVRVL